MKRAVTRWAAAGRVGAGPVTELLAGVAAGKEAPRVHEAVVAALPDVRTRVCRTVLLSLAACVRNWSASVPVTDPTVAQVHTRCSADGSR